MLKPKRRESLKALILVNVPSIRALFLKLAYDLALHSPAAQEAAQALRPIQQGVGAPRGMEVIAHVCSPLYEQAYAILKMDATNGFQEIKRASLHRAVLRRCPSLLSLFKKYYTHTHPQIHIHIFSSFYHFC